MKKYKKIICTIILIIMLIIFGLLLKKVDANSQQDDILFFKLFGSSSTSTSNVNNEIVFDMSNKNKDTKNINLLETVNTQFLVQEKIAPGSEGNFSIKIVDNEKYEEAKNYNITFKSKNAKPQNLYFYLNDNEDEKYATLEEMQNVIEQKLNNKKQKEIIINWKWEYNNSNEGNKQDTADGMKIKEYNFDIDIAA